MRLIDADALMKEFADFVRASNNSDFEPVPTWNDAVSLVGSMPSVEREKGHWINLPHGNGFFHKCSNCRKVSGYGSGDLWFNFCPNCGADMRGEEDE